MALIVFFLKIPSISLFLNKIAKPLLKVNLAYSIQNLSRFGNHFIGITVYNNIGITDKEGPEMKELTKLEELVMMAIWRLKDDAYGVNIKNKVKEIGGREYFYNTLYTTFDQLARKGYVSKHFGEPSAVRGGKRKVYFRISKEGRCALESAYNRHSRVWAGIKDDSFRREYS